MKKIISLILVLVLCLSLCACGGSDTAQTSETPDETTTPSETTETLLTKDEMLAVAVELGDYEADFVENKLRAEETYLGNTYVVTGTVTGIESEYIELQSLVGTGFGKISLELPKEDLMALTTGQRIKVVGKFESFVEEETDVGFGYTETAYNSVMTNGYVVSDRFEMSGLLRMYYVSFRDINGKVSDQYGDESAWAIGLDITDDNVLAVNYSLESEIPVEHVPGQDITSVQFGGQEIKNETRITVSAKIIDNDLVDAELVSIDE